MRRNAAPPPAPANLPLRFAHPFFTSVPPQNRPQLAGVGQRMQDWVNQNLNPVPAAPTGVLQLQDVIGAAGAQEIANLGTLRFHAVGDTGRVGGSSDQEEVSLDMATDYHPDGNGHNPAFLLHLGDVIYGQSKANAYRDEFYRPYKNYPGKILAIAGNHDGEVYPGTDPQSLAAFEANFLAPAPAVPPIAASVGIFRQTVTQPGVYWFLDGPLLQIVGLYSNTGEGPGFLADGAGDNTQQQWLAQTLATVSAQRAQSRKALIFAVHHPPFSQGGHAGSPQLLADLDQICQAAGVMPDAVLAGHSHNYQRHTRRLSFQGRPMEIPFVVAGCGGHADQRVDPASSQTIGDHTFDKSRRGYGYLLVTVTPQRLTLELWPSPSAGSLPFDRTTVDLATNRLLP